MCSNNLPLSILLQPPTSNRFTLHEDEQLQAFLWNFCSSRVEQETLQQQNVTQAQKSRFDRFELLEIMLSRRRLLRCK
uniref:Uncharacterized protein n=1 Tax=Arundo donax TaxID=35708 RepID=A0A0A9D1F2_ARUDO